MKECTIVSPPVVVLEAQTWRLLLSMMISKMVDELEEEAAATSSSSCTNNDDNASMIIRRDTSIIKSLVRQYLPKTSNPFGPLKCDWDANDLPDPHDGRHAAVVTVENSMSSKNNQHNDDFFPRKSDIIRLYLQVVDCAYGTKSSREFRSPVEVGWFVYPRTRTKTRSDDADVMDLSKNGIVQIQHNNKEGNGEYVVLDSIAFKEFRQRFALRHYGNLKRIMMEDCCLEDMEVVAKTSNYCHCKFVGESMGCDMGCNIHFVKLGDDGQEAEEDSRWYSVLQSSWIDIVSHESGSETYFSGLQTYFSAIPKGDVIKLGLEAAAGSSI